MQFGQKREKKGTILLAYYESAHFETYALAKPSAG